MKSLVLLLVLLGCAAAEAQPVYRCGPDGRSYSDTPCSQGRIVDSRDERTDEQRRAGLAVVASQRALGNAMEAQRLEREAHAVPMGAIKIDGRVGAAHVQPDEHQAHPSKTRKKRKHHASVTSEEPGFKAVAPRLAKPKP